MLFEVIIEEVLNHQNQITPAIFKWEEQTN